MAVDPAREQAALKVIATSADKGSLRNLLANARTQGSTVVEQAALRRLSQAKAASAPGSVEADFWQTIHAFEELRSQEKGKTTRLSYTRRKIARVGERRTLADFAASARPTDNFHLMIERGLPEMTGEAIILRHRGDFDATVVQAAERRLVEAGVDTDALPRG